MDMISKLFIDTTLDAIITIIVILSCTISALVIYNKTKQDTENNGNKSWLGFTSFIIAIVFWIVVPILFYSESIAAYTIVYLFPIANIVGLILGFIGLKKQKNYKILCVLSIILNSIASSILFYYMIDLLWWALTGFKQ